MRIRIAVSVLPVVLIAGWLNLASGDSLYLPAQCGLHLTVLGRPDMLIFKYTPRGTFRKSVNRKGGVPSL